MHAHGHPHVHPINKNNKEKNILVAASLNFSFVIVEIIAWVLTNSVAILSDALHDFGDSIALFSAYFAEKSARKPKDSKRTFGYARISIFSALFSALVLGLGSLYILFEAVQRLFNPQTVSSLGMILVACVGITINALGCMRLKQGRSLNEKVLSWHLLEDVMGWCAVLVSGIIIFFTHWFIVDSLLTVAYTLFILYGVSKNLKPIFNILLQGVPENIDVEVIKKEILELNFVTDVHDIHVWSLDGEKSIFTAHITVSGTESILVIKKSVRDILFHHNINHSTIEYERSEECKDGVCAF